MMAYISNGYNIYLSTFLLQSSKLLLLHTMDAQSQGMQGPPVPQFQPQVICSDNGIVVYASLLDMCRATVCSQFPEEIK